MIVQNLGDIFYSNIIEHLKLCCFKFGLWNNAWFVEKHKTDLRVSLWCYRKEGWWRSNLLDPNPRIRILPEKNDRPRNVEGVPCQDPGDVPKIIWNENFQIIVDCISTILWLSTNLFKFHQKWLVHLSFSFWLFVFLCLFNFVNILS
jgi:hypothetical protein